MTNKTVAIFSPGEMGSRIGTILAQAGWQVVTCLENRSQDSHHRAELARMMILPDLDTVIAVADLVLSVVPPKVSLPMATRVARAMVAQKRSIAYLDLNAISPMTAIQVAETITSAGGTAIDGTIIGSAEGLPVNSRLFISGPAEAQIVEWLIPDLPVTSVGDTIGQASSLKMFYAGMTKGISALGWELLAGADRAGLASILQELWQTTQPHIAAFLDHALPDLPPRANRRAQEMEELADTLSHFGLTSHMAQGARQVLSDINQAHHHHPAPLRSPESWRQWWLDLHDG